MKFNTSSITINEEKNNENQDKSRMLNAAVGYAKLLGWHVFPLHTFMNGKCSCGNPNCRNIGKHPITRNGFKDATNDINAIQQYWTRYPWANIGIRTGEESKIFVLDVDGAKGKNTLEDLISKHGPLPDTVQSITGSGGEHYLFKFQEGIGSKTGFKPGLDIRGTGGYIVAPMSIHETGNRYEWELSSRPLETEIADAPDWLIDMVTDKPFTLADRPQPKPSSHWQKLMQGLSEGEGRNPAAASIVGHLLSRGVDLLLVYELMHLWNERNDPPLEVEELNTVIVSISNKHFKRRGR